MYKMRVTGHFSLLLNSLTIRYAPTFFELRLHMSIDGGSNHNVLSVATVGEAPSSILCPG